MNTLLFHQALHYFQGVKTKNFFVILFHSVVFECSHSLFAPRLKYEE